MSEPLVAEFEARREEMTEIRHRLHAHPELSFEEASTSAFVAEKLEAWGWAVTRNVGGHGVLARMRAGTGSTRGIAIRADMDALPITEQTGLPYASRFAGKMHACGHDGHTAILLGAARHLARTRRFNGVVTLIFQPAEEAGVSSGAQAMIADGLFERFPFDAIFGLHTHPGAPEGDILLRSGAMMAAADTARITVRGKGGHAARPHLAVDPLLAACNLVVAMQSIVSRNVDPTQTAVVTVGAMHAGDAPNVIPGVAKIVASVRSFDPAIRDLLESRIRRMAESVCEAHDATAETDYVRGYPVLVNSAAETEFARRVARSVVGADRVSECPLIPGSEDFAFYLQHKPGCFLRLGNGVHSASVHSSRFDFADASLATGAALWVRLVEEFLPLDRGSSAAAHFGH